MNSQDFILKISAEGRAWAQLLLPIISAGIIGWLQPQPKHMQKDSDK